MHLSKFLNTNSGKILTSIILGLGLATLFRKVCVGDNCKIYKAPSFDKIDNQIYKFNNKCYNFTKNNINCNNNINTYIM